MHRMVSINGTVHTRLALISLLKNRLFIHCVAWQELSEDIDNRNKKRKFPCNSFNPKFLTSSVSIWPAIAQKVYIVLTYLNIGNYTVDSAGKHVIVAFSRDKFSTVFRRIRDQEIAWQVWGQNTIFLYSCISILNKPYSLVKLYPSPPPP